MNIRIATALLAASLSPPALAISYTLYDFGVTPFDEHNNTSQISYPGIGYVPSPGGGTGEKYDLEGLQVAVDQNYVHIALASSFAYRVGNLRIGDLFIGIDGGNPYGFAIDIGEVGAPSTGTFDFYQVAAWGGLQDIPGSYGYSGYNDWSDVTGQAGAHEIANGSQIGTVDYALSFFADSEPNPLGNGSDDTYLWEFTLDRALLGVFNLLDFHIVVGCGNDLLEESFELTSDATTPGITGIPEPPILLLLGLGVPLTLAAHAYYRSRHLRGG